MMQRKKMGSDEGFELVDSLSDDYGFDADVELDVLAKECKGTVPETTDLKELASKTVTTLKPDDKMSRELDNLFVELLISVEANQALEELGLKETTENVEQKKSSSDLKAISSGILNFRE